MYVYAVVPAPPAGPLPRGLAGEPLRVVEAAGLAAVVGDVGAAPEVTPSTLRAHDKIASAVAALSSALLPSRFGAVLDGDEALRRFLEDHAGPLGDALAEVAGCRQMTLRLSTAPGREPGTGPPEAGGGARGGPGTRYLRARAAAEPQADPRVRGILDSLEGHVRATRVEGHSHPPLVASIHHLVPLAGIAAYEAAVAAAAAAQEELRVRASGPFLPYAFAPGSLT